MGFLSDGETYYISGNGPYDTPQEACLNGDPITKREMNEEYPDIVYGGFCDVLLAPAPGSIKEDYVDNSHKTPIYGTVMISIFIALLIFFMFWISFR